MAALLRDQVLRLHAAIVEARLTGNRTVLLQGIVRAFVDRWEQHRYAPLYRLL
jgi:hypothetical protein